MGGNGWDGCRVAEWEPDGAWDKIDGPIGEKTDG